MSLVRHGTECSCGGMAQTDAPPKPITAGTVCQSDNGFFAGYADGEGLKKIAQDQSYERHEGFPNALGLITPLLIRGLTRDCCRPIK